MKQKFLTLILILAMLVSCFNVFAFAEVDNSSTSRIVVASVSFSKVKTKQEVKALSQDILDDYTDVFKLAKEYTADFKKFKKNLKKFLVESEEDYDARCAEKQEMVDELVSNIKVNTKKYNRAVKNNNKKNIDYYQSLITADKNSIAELSQLLKDDKEVFNAVKDEVVGQLKAAKKINRNIKKNKNSSTKSKNRFSKLSSKFVSGNGKKKNVLKKVVDSAATLNQRLFMLETKCRKQIQYFDEYNNADNQ